MSKWATVLVLCLSMALFPLSHSVCSGAEGAKQTEEGVSVVDDSVTDEAKPVVENAETDGRGAWAEEDAVGHSAAPARGPVGISPAAWAGLSAGAIAVYFLIQSLTDDDGDGGQPTTPTTPTHQDR